MEQLLLELETRSKEAANEHKHALAKLERELTTAHQTELKNTVDNLVEKHKNEVRVISDVTTMSHLIC